jgi:hypothetical protein
MTVKAGMRFHIAFFETVSGHGELRSEWEINAEK